MSKVFKTWQQRFAFVCVVLLAMFVVYICNVNSETAKVVLTSLGIVAIFYLIVFAVVSWIFRGE